jgi:hypothetical protein
MTTSNTNFKLGKFDRLYVAQTDGALDSDYILVKNENDVELSWKAEKDSVATKSGGKITIPTGDDSWSIKVTCDAVFTDPGFTFLYGAQEGAVKLQIRNTVDNMVMLEGFFTANDLSIKSMEKGARQSTFSFENSDVISAYFATGGRAVVG